jgi:hypothetical protein
MKKIIPILLLGFLCANMAFSQEAVRKSVPGAKIYFSDMPFTTSNSGSKSSFTSSDFIYGRLELDNKTLLEAFGLPKDGESPMYNKNDCYLRYRVTVYKDGEQNGQPNFWDFLYVWGNEKKNTAFNFDILPEPAKSKSMLCGTENFSSGIAAGPLYHIINQERFPANGDYTIRVTLFQQSVDAWGNMEQEENWPVMEEDFSFRFDTKDIKTLKTNGDAAGELVMENALRLDKMPEWFSKAGKVDDPKVTNATIAAILKRDIPTKSIIKFVVGEFSGPTWMVEKDEYGLIIQRTLMPTINIAYKRDGKCYIGTVRLWEPYEGNGKYGTLMVGSESSGRRSDYWLDCSLVK